MDKSAEQPIKPPQSLTLYSKNNNNYGNPINQQSYPTQNPPFPAQNIPYTYQAYPNLSHHKSLMLLILNSVLNLFLLLANFAKLLSLQ